MRVALFALGTHGDVRPMAALGMGLLQAGHEVRIAAQPRFAPMLAALGLDTVALAGNMQDVTDLSAVPVVQGKVKIPFGASALIERMARTWAEEGMATADGADLIVSIAGATPLSAAVAEAAGLPMAVAHPHPGGLVRQVPMSTIPGWNAFLMATHPFSWWHSFAKGVNTHVRPRLGLRKSPWYGPDYGLRVRRTPKLFAFSPALVPPRPNVPDFARVTGFWTLDTRRSWQPPPALVDFLEAGPPPVYLGFGSMPDPRPDLTAQLIVDAVRPTKHRAIVAAGWSGTTDIGGELGGDRVLALDEAPHDWLFPRVHAAVHHCGAGTVAAALRAGIPSVPVPFWADQFLWSWALHRAGAASRPVRRPTLTPARLTAALARADDPVVRDSAAALGERVRAEDGVAAALDALRGWGLLA